MGARGQALFMLITLVWVFSHCGTVHYGHISLHSHSHLLVHLDCGLWFSPGTSSKQSVLVEYFLPLLAWTLKFNMQQWFGESETEVLGFCQFLREWKKFRFVLNFLRCPRRIVDCLKSFPLRNNLHRISEVFALRQLYDPGEKNAKKHTFAEVATLANDQLQLQNISCLLLFFFYNLKQAV